MRLKQNFYLLTLLFLALLNSCSQEEQIVSETETQQNENFINLNDVSSIATTIQYPTSIDNTDFIQGKTTGTTKQTLSSSNMDTNGTSNITKTIESITKVPDENGNTSYYIINYENEGFLLMSADKRVNPVLAFSNTGKFSLDIDQYPNGLVEWAVNTKDVIKDVRETNLELTD